VKKERKTFGPLDKEMGRVLKRIVKPYNAIA
jgi:hypothetical protein